jgi:Tfp pilus assembly protein PilX
MPGSRGLATLFVLVLLALACIAMLRRMERQRRVIRNLRNRAAFDAARAVRGREWSQDDHDTADELTDVGIVQTVGGARYLDRARYDSWRRRRVRVALGGAVGIVLLVVIVGLIVLR